MRLQKSLVTDRPYRIIANYCACLEKFTRRTPHSRNAPKAYIVRAAIGWMVPGTAGASK